ncbi:MAG TPA: cobyrinate a,c-diamide synthase [Desulfatiglandales bacterium]|nr:cobyrinate a,c-diamide synthase [Desulfatiglandales bacterium]
MLGIPPRIILAALRGGSGKTILTLGLISSWREKGFKVSPFKKGPDFIDAGWLAFAAGKSCHNLDPFLMTETQIIESFLYNSTGSDISLIEGNRGLFDGFDFEGCSSTASLGKLLKTPAVLIVDVTMATRTMAAVVMGCQKFDPDLKIAAVILNRVAGPRQESIVKNSIEKYCGIPVVGSVPKLKENLFPERHMGLVPHQERDHSEKAIAWTRTIVEKNLDLETLWALAHDVRPLDSGKGYQEKKPFEMPGIDPPRIGFIRDKAFWFYYPENLDQLKNMGAVLVEINSLTEKELPDLDALYIGGGFPETQAKALADNRSFRESLKKKIDSGLHVYAECGGLLYLGENIIVNDNTYPMAGALPLKFVLEKKPQGHGYTILETAGENPYYRIGEVLKGHEFHYSRPLMDDSDNINTVFKVRRGQGLDGQRDGLCKNNLLATFTHMQAAGNPLWGERFFNAALLSKTHKNNFFPDDRKKELKMATI